jgi:hypothetical protein
MAMPMSAPRKLLSLGSNTVSTPVMIGFRLPDIDAERASP